MASIKHKANTEMRKPGGLLQKFFPKASSTSSWFSCSNEDTKRLLPFVTLFVTVFNTVYVCNKKKNI